MSLYAAIYAREFPAQALLRLRPELRSQPCAVLEGDPPLQRVCACNTMARRLGIQSGMTRVEVDTFPHVTVLRRSVTEEASARAALFDCAATFSPAAEDLSLPTAFIGVLDITGTGRLHGPPATLAAALHRLIRAAGISASIAVAHNFHAAICLARGHTTRRALVIPQTEEASALAELPISALDLISEFTPAHGEILAGWGIHTLGDLSALPETALIARMGQTGSRLRQLALGTYPHHFTPVDPAPNYTEAIEFDAPLEQLESLLFVLGAMLDQLILRISSRALAIAAITITLWLEPRGTHARTVRPALPVNDKNLWLKLIHLELEAHAPGAPVIGFTLTAEPGRTSKVQMGLFSPQLPDATRLDVALARVRGLVGEDRVGTPVLLDTHSPDAFQVAPLIVTNQDGKRAAPERSRHFSITQRQVRPAQELFLKMQGQQPASFYFRQKTYQVSRAYGPWFSSGDWWNQTCSVTEQWDLIARCAEETLLCCVVRYPIQNRWHMVACYD